MNGNERQQGVMEREKKGKEWKVTESKGEDYAR